MQVTNRLAAKSWSSTAKSGLRNYIRLCISKGFSAEVFRQNAPLPAAAFPSLRSHNSILKHIQYVLRRHLSQLATSRCSLLLTIGDFMTVRTIGLEEKLTILLRMQRRYTQNTNC